MISQPSYIQPREMADLPPSYSWTPYQHVKLSAKAPKSLMQLVQGISCRATFALNLGVSEWMVYRLQRWSEHRQTDLYVDAQWARTVDKHYLKKSTPPTPDDSGDPATGPLYGLEIELDSAMTNAAANHPERAKSAAGLISLVRYTLPDHKNFDTWLASTLKRFSANFPYDKESPGGVKVPRAFLDPNIPINLDAIDRLLDEQLKAIKRTGNPFLASPQELKAGGFEGEPYRYK